MLTRRDILRQLGAAAVVRPRAQAARSASDALRIGGREVEVRVTPASEITTRITVVAAGAPPTIRGDGSLVDRGWPRPLARLARSTFPTIRSGELTLSVDGARTAGEAFAIRIDGRDRTTQRIAVESQTGALTFALGDGPVLAFGEGGPQFDRRGSIDRMRSGQGGYQLRTHGGRVPIPFLIGTGGWSIFFHQPAGAFNLTGARGRFEPAGADVAVPLDLFVTLSRDPARLMHEYARLTGFPAMPPLWAFGYQQSHRTLASRDEILQEAKTFREKKLPCDALIYLGTGFCPSGWNTDNGEFTFNGKVFPDPDAMIRRLHDDHFKVVLHVVLEGRTLTGTVGDVCTARPLPSGRTPDGRWPDDRQVSCYWPIHKSLFDAGVDGWWPDQGDGLDGPSRLARNRMYFDGSRQLRPNERPYALHRNGHAGMQRYGAFLWSGDVYSTWETLATHVPVAINSGLSGIPFWGTDIGGFVPTKELTGELYVRWFQFGAFCPLFRAHGRTWKLRLPWGWNTGELGPDELSTYTGGAANPDPSELHNAAVEPICRKYLELRYRLLPYLYAAVRDAHDTGLPIIRALWLHYPDEAAAVARGDEYLWGRDILVAPVTEKGATECRVYLPRGTWYDFWTESTHEGGREIVRAVDLETMPLFVRSGAILPLGPVKQYTSERVDEPIALQVYPGADGVATMYEDDGATFAFEQGEWVRIDAVWTDRRRLLTLRLAAGSRRPPQGRRMRIRVAGTSDVREITFTGSPIEVRL
jgi:alpha-glucosidase (family GH31 glycosyl hydrolase)